MRTFLVGVVVVISLVAANATAAGVMFMLAVVLQRAGLDDSLIAVTAICLVGIAVAVLGLNIAARQINRVLSHVAHRRG